jgi:microcystin-dependent protein
MANYEATRYDFNAANLTGIQGVNTGIIIPWSSASVPSGFLECNGSAVSRSTYAALFAVIGTTYGAGNGSTTFNVPNLTDRCCQNESPTKSLATTGGANTVPTTGTVNTAVGNTTIAIPTMASHTHSNNANPATIRGGTNNNADRQRGVRGTGPSTGGGGAHTHPLSRSFSGNATSVLQPYLTLVYIIKT